MRCPTTKTILLFTNPDPTTIYHQHPNPNPVASHPDSNRNPNTNPPSIRPAVLNNQLQTLGSSIRISDWKFTRTQCLRLNRSSRAQRHLDIDRDWHRNDWRVDWETDLRRKWELDRDQEPCWRSELDKGRVESVWDERDTDRVDWRNHDWDVDRAEQSKDSRHSNSSNSSALGWGPDTSWRQSGESKEREWNLDDDLCGNNSQLDCSSTAPGIRDTDYLNDSICSELDWVNGAGVFGILNWSCSSWFGSGNESRWNIDWIEFEIGEVYGKLNWIEDGNDGWFWSTSGIGTFWFLCTGGRI